MTNLAALSGTFADFKLVKTRSTAQIVVEVPIEQADAALAALGGLPIPGSEKPVALARLNDSATPEQPKAKERRSFDELRPSQQAGILCGQGDFQAFLKELYSTKTAAFTEGDAAACVRDFCDVRSRGELSTNETAARQWHTLRTDFEAWKRL